MTQTLEKPATLGFSRRSALTFGLRTAGRPVGLREHGDALESTTGTPELVGMTGELVSESKVSRSPRALAQHLAAESVNRTHDGGAVLGPRTGWGVLVTGGVAACVALLVPTGGAKAAPLATRERVMEVAPQFRPQAETIRWLREAGLKVEQLTRVMGVSRQTIYNWEKGARIDSQHLERLMRVREIIERARRHYPMPEDLVSWLVMPWDRDGGSPLDLMAAGDYARARFFAIAAPATRVRPVEALRDRPVAERFRREREMQFRAEPPEDDEALAALLSLEDDEEEAGTAGGGGG
jgi:DNA-binding transcriptional regulator YiaG